jgi:hypothetical protein
MARAALPAPRRASVRAARWCAKGGTIAAAFTRSGRVALVGTTATRHRRAHGHGLVRARPHSTRLRGIRHRRVRFVAVASRGTIAHPKLLRRYVRLAGLR